MSFVFPVSVAPYTAALPRAGPIHELPSANCSLLDPNELVVPPSVIRILKAGWGEHIPLSALTNHACRTATLSVTRREDTALTIAGDGRLLSKASSIDSSKENTIDIIDWIEAARRFVNAIAKYLHARGDPGPGGPNAAAIAQLFNKHFSSIQARVDFVSNFAAYREYDMTIRRKYLHESHLFDPATFQGPTFDAIQRTHDLRERLQFKDSITRFKGTSTSGFPPTSNRNTSPKKSFRNSNSNSNPRADSGWTKRPPTSGTWAPKKCMYCSSTNHKFSACTASPASTFLKRDELGVWRNSDGQTYCVNHNGPLPCPRASACPHLHSCSLCGSGSHAAQQCGN
jgi:hypothetical protein